MQNHQGNRDSILNHTGTKYFLSSQQHPGPYRISDQHMQHIVLQKYAQQIGYSIQENAQIVKLKTTPPSTRHLQNPFLKKGPTFICRPVPQIKQANIITITSANYWRPNLVNSPKKDKQIMEDFRRLKIERLKNRLEQEANKSSKVKQKKGQYSLSKLYRCYEESKTQQITFR